MVDIKGTIEASKGGTLENLINSIPGYRGYRDKEIRRDADRMMRQFVVARLDEQRKRLAALQLQMVSAGQLDLLDDLDQAVRKLQILIDRMKTATYGYAGFFDAVKVREDQLDALYAFDNAMLNEVAKITAAVTQVTTALTTKQNVAEAIAACVVAAQDANTAFDHRGEVILGGEIPAGAIPAPDAPPAPLPGAGAGGQLSVGTEPPLAGAPDVGLPDQIPPGPDVPR